MEPRTHAEKTPEGVSIFWPLASKALNRAELTATLLTMEVAAGAELNKAGTAEQYPEHAATGVRRSGLRVKVGSLRGSRDKKFPEV